MRQIYRRAFNLFMFISSYISNKITDFLYKKKIISDTQIEYFAYIYCWIIDIILYVLLLSFFGIIMHRFIPTLVFCVIFSLFRLFSGGTHTSSEITCIFISFFLYFIVIFFHPLLLKVNKLFVFLLFILGICFVILISPVDSPKRRFNRIQKKKLKKKSIITCLLLIPLYLLFQLIKMYDYCIIIFLCVMISAVDLTIAFLNSRGKFDDYQYNDL